MMCFSFEMPRKNDRGGTIVVLVFEPENLARMKDGDPFDLQFRAYEGHWNVGTRLREVDLICCYEEDTAAVQHFHKTGDIAGLMKYLERGRKHQPGDATPPIKLCEKRKTQ